MTGSGPPPTSGPLNELPLREITAEMRRMEDRAEVALSTAKASMVMARKPATVFFSSLITRMDYYKCWTIETAATDGRSIFYNPSFFDGLPTGEICGILCHEVLHCTNKHLSRGRGLDQRRFNVAADLAINPVLIDCGIELPKGVLIPGVAPFEDFPTGLSAEEYYSKITPEHMKGFRGMNDPAGTGGMIGDSDNTAATERRWDVAVAQAAQAATRIGGEVPAGLQRYIQKLLEPAHNWREELREFMVSASKDLPDWNRPNRRYVGSGYYLPSHRGFDIGHVGLLIDTSGSIGNETLSRFASEVWAIAQEGVSKMTILYHDAEVAHVQEWTPNDGELVLEPKGGGGTDHRPCFRWIEKNLNEPPTILIALTDLASSFPKREPNYPVLWASTCSTGEHPWGRRIDIPEV